MHTSAHVRQDWPEAQYTGTLIRAAEARAGELSADGHTVPLLCLDVQLDNALQTVLHCEQAFPSNHFHQAELAARRLKAGMRVTVQAPMAGMRLVARFVSHIHVLKEEAPCHKS